MPSRPKNIDQQAVKEAIAQGEPPDAVAARLGMSPLAIGLIMGNSPVRERRYKRSFDLDRAIELRKQGMSYDAIGSELGYGIVTVFNRLKPVGIVKPPKPKTERLPKPKPTHPKPPPRGEAMWQQYITGTSVKELMSKYGTSRQRISQLFKAAGHHDAQEQRKAMHAADLAKKYPVGMEIGYHTVISEPFLAFHQYRMNLRCCRCGYVSSLSQSDVELHKDCRCSANKDKIKQFALGCEIGARFGAWTVIGETIHTGKSPHKMRAVPCRCDCGTERNIWANVLRQGKSHSCGCQTAARYRATKAAKKGVA